jgi:Domain of Unknown Function with PDB structure (DUF3857)
MRSLLFVFLGIVFSIKSISQTAEPNPKFGEVSQEALTMKYYKLDSTAEAVVLYDFGEASMDIFNRSIVFYLTVHERIKIFKKSALGRATVEIPYYTAGHNQDEFIDKIEGVTYNTENGTTVKTKLTKDMIFRSKTSNNTSILKFSLPNAKEGSVIEYTYRIMTPFAISDNPKTWSFQSSLPVAWSEYLITIPNYFIYQTLMYGYITPFIHDTEMVNYDLAGRATLASKRRLVMKDLPAFRKEPYITSPSDYMSHITFELAKVDWPGELVKNYSLDWANLNQTLLESDNFGRITKKTNIFKNEIKEMGFQPKDTLERIKAAYQLVQSSMKWDKTNGIFTKDLKKKWEEKKGDAGDINHLLMAFIKELGYEVQPVVMSTRGHGRVHPVYVLLKNFDYVVARVKVGNEFYFLDATNPHLKFGMLPFQCLNSSGWIVGEQNNGKIDIISKERDSNLLTANLTITDDGELKGTIEKSYAGYSNLMIQEEFKEEGKDKFLESLKKDKTAWNIEKSEFENTNDPNQAFNAKYTVSMTDYVTDAGNMMYLKPMISEAETENPFKAPERLYDVDFGCLHEQTFMATYILPKGYSVLEVPKPMRIALPENSGRFTYSVSAGDGKIQVISRLMLSKPTYSSDEYFHLKEFYNQVVAKHGEQIVLKKN